MPTTSKFDGKLLRWDGGDNPHAEGTKSFDAVELIKRRGRQGIRYETFREHPKGRMNTLYFNARRGLITAERGNRVRSGNGSGKDRRGTR